MVRLRGLFSLEMGRRGREERSENGRERGGGRKPGREKRGGEERRRGAQTEGNAEGSGGDPDDEEREGAGERGRRETFLFVNREAGRVRAKRLSRNFATASPPTRRFRRDYGRRSWV